MSTIFTQFHKLWINPIDCSKEACPPPCALVKKCDDLDTEIDINNNEVRFWDNVTCIAVGGGAERFIEQDMNWVSFLPADHKVPVKSWLAIYGTKTVREKFKNELWSGDRAVIGVDKAVKAGNQTWSLKIGSDQSGLWSAEDMVTLPDGKQMKGIDFCKSVYENSTINLNPGEYIEVL